MVEINKENLKIYNRKYYKLHRVEILKKRKLSYLKKHPIIVKSIILPYIPPHNNLVYFN
jgi:hypothetical protein